MAARVFWRKVQLLARRHLLRQRVIRHYVPAIDAYMYIDLEDSGFSRTIFYRGVHEPLTTRLVQQELAPGMRVLDVGANMGYYVLLEARAVGPQGHVYALEPVPQTFALLQRNVALNDVRNVDLYQLALGGEDGEATMYVLDKLNWSHLASRYQSSARMENLRSHHRQTVQVPVRTLGTFLQEAGIDTVNFLRMDVEGYELDIVRGGLDALARLSRQGLLKLFMEVHPFLAEDRTPYLDMVRQLHNIGLRAKLLVYREQILSQWPSLEETLSFLADYPFREAPHVVFSNE